MQTSPRNREFSGPYPEKNHLDERRRGHVPQISISDDNHHVTEAIGDLYGDQNYGRRDSRPLSFLPSPLNDGFSSTQHNGQSNLPGSFAARSSLNPILSHEGAKPLTNGQAYTMTGRSNSFGRENGGTTSPTRPLAGVRSPSDTANSSFPLNDLDYESNPAAVAQELSNLQALRRMSMDVNATGDPDLPSFNSNFGMPTVAPTGSADEDDASRLFWVPARLHPELAPKEFKTFLDNRVDSIKRPSGDFSLSPDGPQRQGSGGGLRRKKSMLSRQIDNSEGRGAVGYQDGAERLGRKKSLSGQDVLNTGISNLQELEVLVNDPAKVIQRLSIDTGQKATGGEVPASEDMPILPAAPSGGALRRSTRTTYRRGSLRKGERVGPSKRAAKSIETDTDELSSSSPITPTVDTSELTRVRSDPPQTNHLSDKPAENFSRPGRLNRSLAISPEFPQIPPIPPLDKLTASPNLTSPPSRSSLDVNDRASINNLPAINPAPMQRTFVSQIASNGRSTTMPGVPPTGMPIRAKPAPQPIQIPPVPNIVETPPPPDETRKVLPASPKSTLPSSPKQFLPERSSSHEPPSTAAPSTMPPSSTLTNPSQLQTSLPSNPAAARGGKRPGLVRQNQSEKGHQTLRDMAANPSPLPGNSTRTDSLSFIPTLTEDKKPEVKKPTPKKEAAEPPRKPSWGGWFSSSDEKEKEKRKEEEAKEAAKKTKVKLLKPADKSHDNTRLDVLQTTINPGRESLVLERGDLKLEEERKKESSRKSSGEAKKEKETSLFSSIFGGGKKKAEKEPFGKKLSSRNLSPDPPHPALKPDIDYNWTRFSILEERAIYRMAHIKLANPRRALYSQVLLSNFMYSYLAKVQQMHPQMQIPQNAAQKAQQRQQQQQQQQQQQKKADQPEEYYQYQKYQEQQQQQDQAQAQNQTHGQASHSQQSNGAPYVDDAQTYNYDHGDPDDRHRPRSRASQHNTHSSEAGPGHYASNGVISHQSGANPGRSNYQYQQSQFDDPQRTDEDDMW